MRFSVPTRADGEWWSGKLREQVWVTELLWIRANESEVDLQRIEMKPKGPG